MFHYLNLGIYEVLHPFFIYKNNLNRNKLFVSAIVQNDFIIRGKKASIVLNILPTSIKSINPMRKYPILFNYLIIF